MSVWIVAVAAGLVALLHTLAPDHWLPLAVMARTRRWSRSTLAAYTSVAAAVHVGGSAAIGLLVVAAGETAMARLAHWEGPVLGSVLVVFGIVYLVLAWRAGGHFHLHLPRPAAANHQHAHEHHDHGHEHHHPADAHRHHDDGEAHGPRGNHGAWAAVLAVGLAPCVTLWPVLLAAAPTGWVAVSLAMAVFTVVTWAAMIILTALAVAGSRRFQLPWLERDPELVTGLLLVGLGLAAFLF